MKTKLLNVWEKLRSSYWFLPSVMAVGAFLLAAAALWIDYLLPALGFDGIRWLSWNEVDGARALLSTVAGSVGRP